MKLTTVITDVTPNPIVARRSMVGILHRTIRPGAARYFAPGLLCWPQFTSPLSTKLSGLEDFAAHGGSESLDLRRLDTSALPLRTRKGILVSLFDFRNSAVGLP